MPDRSAVLQLHGQPGHAQQARKGCTGKAASRAGGRAGRCAQLFGTRWATCRDLPGQRAEARPTWPFGSQGALRKRTLKLWTTCTASTCTQPVLCTCRNGPAATAGAHLGAGLLAQTGCGLQALGVCVPCQHKGVVCALSGLDPGRTRAVLASDSQQGRTQVEKAARWRATPVCPAHQRSTAAGPRQDDLAHRSRFLGKPGSSIRRRPPRTDVHSPAAAGRRRGKLALLPLLGQPGNRSAEDPVQIVPARQTSYT